MIATARTAKTMIAKRAEFSKIFNICGRFGIRRMTTSKPNVSGCDKEVLFECKNNRGIITLNKPKALNAINYPMVCRILEKLQEWESDVDMVIIRGTGRAFCAGGDIVDITREGPSKAHKGKLFFKHEYLMNNFIGTYRKPYVALIDGITMGGGMGLSVHGKYRIATENTLCAMPETAIGLFPDVGGTYFLSRLPGAIGMFLALTGHRLKGADVCKAGIGTHFCSSKNMHELFDALVNKINPCNIQNEITQYTEDISSVQFSLALKAVVIQRIFSLTTVEDIFCALEAEGTDFCLKTLELLKKMSPTSLKLTVKGLHKGKHMSLQECLQMECRMAGHVMEACISNDFYEGVRALLIDKDKKPKWCPKLEDISDEMIETYFKPLQPDEELNI